MDIKTQVTRYIGEGATKALLEEVSATPKPGLVDRKNSGAHDDMDFFTFMNSAAALSPYFLEMAQAGYDCTCSLDQLFLVLRKIGVEAEKAMFKATKGINTHKGLIFSLGILSGAAGYYHKEEGRFDVEDILRLCGKITSKTIEAEFEAIKAREPRTKGEALYIQYGVRGIRAEAMSGFQSVREISLPLMKKLLQEGKEKNDVYVQVLLQLMAKVEDTNILGRHDFDKLYHVQELARRALARGGIFSKQGKQYIEEMDEAFIKGRVSPGGCADLLAITIMSDHLMQR
jgi:triphosphoribosyl-dephospho-CoA synthase CitG